MFSIAFIKKVILCALLMTSGQGLAFSKLKKYFADYNLGFNSIRTSDSITVSYKFSDPNLWGPNCERKSYDAELVCKISLGQAGRGFLAEQFGGFGIFFQQPFKRTGLFYLSGELGFGFVSAAGELSSEEISRTGVGQYLTEMSYSFYGIRAKPYLQFGITPDNFIPDILFSVGPVFQFFGGSTSINNQKRNVFIAQGSRLFSGVNPLNYAYLELEIVFYRFKDGAFSLYSSRAAQSDFYAAGKFYPEDVNGMTDFEVSLASRETGLKLLLNWP